MKKLFCFLTALIAAVCLLSAGLTAGAYDDTADAVIDEDDLFSSGEEARLSEKISRLSEQYGLDLVILTVNDLGSAYSADDFVDAWRASYRGEDVLILMIYNARNRDTRTYTSLGYGLGYQATGNYFFDCIPDKTHIEKKLSADRFYDACDEYLSLAGRFLKENARGKLCEAGFLCADKQPGYFPVFPHLPNSDSKPKLWLVRRLRPFGRLLRRWRRRYTEILILNTELGVFVMKWRKTGAAALAELLRQSRADG